jgi:hypothetical protein
MDLVPATQVSRLGASILAGTTAGAQAADNSKFSLWAAALFLSRCCYSFEKQDVREGDHARASDEKPNHREDFNRLLNAAVRKREPED